MSERLTSASPETNALTASRPRRRRDSSPRTIHVADAAPPRDVPDISRQESRRCLGSRLVQTSPKPDALDRRRDASSRRARRGGAATSLRRPRGRRAQREKHEQRDRRKRLLLGARLRRAHLAVDGQVAPRAHGRALAAAAAWMGCSPLQQSAPRLQLALARRMGSAARHRCASRRARLLHKGCLCKSFASAAAVLVGFDESCFSRGSRRDCWWHAGGMAGAVRRAGSSLPWCQQASSSLPLAAPSRFVQVAICSG